MHRDIARLLVFLAVVRVVTVVACPAPAPPPPKLIHQEADRQLRLHATRRKPAIPRPNRDFSYSHGRVSVPDRWGDAPPDTGPSLPTRHGRTPEPHRTSQTTRTGAHDLPRPAAPRRQPRAAIPPGMPPGPPRRPADRPPRPPKPSALPDRPLLPAPRGRSAVAVPCGRLGAAGDGR